MRETNKILSMDLTPSRRSPDWGMIPGLGARCEAEISLLVYERMCLIRAFEQCAREAQDKRQLDALIYLSLGQEATASSLSVVFQGSYVLAQHRGHAAYLAFGGDPTRLIDELLGLPSGCCKGMGGSPPIHDISKKIIGHCGLIGDQVPVAVGIAMGAPGEKVICFLGDGAAEEDYVLAALGYASSYKHQVLFVCEDNDLSVLTPTSVRRTWFLEDVSRAFGMPAVDITDDPWLIRHYGLKFRHQLPALINVRTCRDIWHVGTGRDGNPEWNRFELVEHTLRELGLWDEACRRRARVFRAIEGLWRERLQIRSESSPKSI